MSVASEDVVAVAEGEPATDREAERRAQAEGDAAVVASLAGSEAKLWPSVARSQGWGPSRAQAAVAVLRVRAAADAKVAEVEARERALRDAEEREVAVRAASKIVRLVPGPSQAEIDAERAAADEAEASKVRLTELGNSQRLVQRYGHKLRFCRALGGWFVWTGMQWKPDTTGAVMRCAKLVVRGFWTEAAKCADADARDAMRAHAKRSEKAAALAAMVKLAETGDGIAIESDAFDADPWTLNCKSGILDLRTMRLRAHDPAALCRKFAPVAFVQGAKAELFEKTLAEILPDAEVRAFVQRFFGYSLTGVIRERILALFIGRGRNGKSLLIKLITRLMGDYATYAAPQLLMMKEHGERHPTELADLCGIRFAAMSEVKEGQAFDVETMKRLTGDELVKARFMNRDFFTFNATWKMALASNHHPKVKDRTDSSWDRLREVPFTVRIDDAKKDKQLFEKLERELPGVLNWCLAGCAAWQANGLGTAAAIAKATGDYRDGENPVAPFFTECVVFGERGAQVARKELYTAYEAWARAEGERFPVGTKAFAEAVRERGAEDDKSHGIRRWRGARLKDESERQNAAKTASSASTEAHDSRPGTPGGTDYRPYSQTPPRENNVGNSCPLVSSDEEDEVFEAAERAAFEAEEYDS